MTNSKKRILLSLFPPMIFIIILLIFQFVQSATNAEMFTLGVHPKDFSRIVGIFTYVFVHGSWGHLAANSISIFVLMWCLFYFYKDYSYVILAIIWLGSGLLTFYIGRPSWHIGASGLVYGLAFFNFTSGLLSRTRAMIAISLLTAFLYGSMVWSITPFFVESDVSWEGHLSGATFGIIAALLFYRKGCFAKKVERVYNEQEDEELYARWMTSLEEKKLAESQGIDISPFEASKMHSKKDSPEAEDRQRDCETVSTSAPQSQKNKAQILDSHSIVADNTKKELKSPNL